MLEHAAHIFRSSLTGKDNKSYDVARIGLALMSALFAITILVITIALVVGLYKQPAHSFSEIMDGLRSWADSVARLYAAYAGLNFGTSWGIGLKSHTEPEVEELPAGEEGK